MKTRLEMTQESQMEQDLNREQLIADGRPVMRGECPPGYVYSGHACPYSRHMLPEGCLCDLEGLDDPIPSDCGHGVTYWMPANK